MAKILVVDDDANFAHSLISAYRVYRHEVFYRADATSALRLAKRMHFDAIILSTHIHEQSGIEICRKLRAAGIESPIIFITNDNSLDTLQAALAQGGDGYLVRPFTPAELMIRTQAILVRPPRPQQIQRWNQLQLNDHNCQVVMRSQLLQLSRREYALLSYMLRYPTKIHHRMELVRLLADLGKNVDEACIDVHICNLRKRLKQAKSESLIQTVYGLGYRINISALKKYELHNPLPDNYIIS